MVTFILLQNLSFMFSLFVITCLLFQTAVAVYLLNISKMEDDFDRNLRKLLIILLIHLGTKFLLLAVLRNVFLYTQIPTGFGLAYGPLMYIVTRNYIGRPISSRGKILQLFPFLFFSVIYMFIVVLGSRKLITEAQIVQYASVYQWLVVASLVGYPVCIKRLLVTYRRAESLPPEKGKLISHIATTLLAGMACGLFLTFTHWIKVPIPEFDLRLLPYICFSAIPVLILRYRLQKSSVPEVDLALIKAHGAHPLSVVAIASAEAPLSLSGRAAPLAHAAPVVPSEKRYEKSGLDTAMLQGLESNLQAFMRKSKIFLDPELSLDELASQMKMPKHHLTQLLNEQVKKNFYTFINEYRIQEAITQLKNPDVEVNILSLAYECGFNSRSSFNNYFKKITGHTPSAFRKEVLHAEAAS